MGVFFFLFRWLGAGRDKFVGEKFVGLSPAEWWYGEIFFVDGAVERFFIAI